MSGRTKGCEVAIEHATVATAQQVNLNAKVAEADKRIMKNTVDRVTRKFVHQNVKIEKLEIPVIRSCVS
jgi:hypothetical protein